MSIDLVIDLYAGFHFPGELRMINRLADSVSDGAIVAIGSYRGQTDSALALHAHVPVYAVDTHTPSDDYPFGDADRTEWMRNILNLGLSAKVRPINLPSLIVASVWTEPIGFLWIDGNHAEAKADLEAWLPFVVPGGLIGFHDNNRETVMAAALGRDDLTEIERCDLTTIYRKQSPYETYTYNGLTLDVRTGVYNAPDKHAVQEAQSYPLPDGEVRTAIDAGAMIGDWTAWIHQRYPDAEILAIEPEPGNFALLARNTADYARVLNGALGYDEALVNLVVDPVNPGGHRLVGAAQPGQIIVAGLGTWSLEGMMTSDFERVDILKLDIEGSEVDVLLNAAADTLRRIGFICGERHVTHEAFTPVIARLQALGFDVIDTPHPELSSPPWNMADRGLFTAINMNSEESDTEALPFEYGLPVEEEEKPPVKRAPTRKKVVAKGRRR